MQVKKFDDKSSTEPVSVQLCRCTWSRRPVTFLQRPDHFFGEVQSDRECANSHIRTYILCWKRARYGESKRRLPCGTSRPTPSYGLLFSVRLRLRIIQATWRSLQMHWSPAISADMRCFFSLLFYLRLLEVLQRRLEPLTTTFPQPQHQLPRPLIISPRLESVGLIVSMQIPMMRCPVTSPIN